MFQQRFENRPTELPGVCVLKRLVQQDARGFLERLFCSQELRNFGFAKPVTQVNHTLTHRPGAIRGLHFQYPPNAEMKLVTCIRGSVFDVAVDLRQGSNTFLQWHGEELSAANSKSLLIPEGFAHGFQTLVPDCELLYLHTANYAPDSEGAVHALDPSIAIEWPLEVNEMSDRDRAHPFLDRHFLGVPL